MNIVTDDNCIVDVNRLDDPEEAKKLQHLLQLQSYKKNIISYTEFDDKYSKLFKKNQDIPVDELQELSSEYMGRIDPYNPVYIVHDASFSTVEELIKPDNIVMILPAIWNKVGVINNTGEDGINVLQAFNNIAAQGMSDVGDKKKKAYSDSICLAIQLMSDQNKLAENKQKAQDMAKNLMTVQEDKTLAENDNKDYLSDDDIAKYQGIDNDKPNEVITEHEEFL